MTTLQALWIIYIIPIPAGIMLINGIDYLCRGKHRRGNFLYLKQHGLRNNMRVHGLLYLGNLMLIVSWLWKPAETPFHLLMTAWFIFINIHAILKRRKPTPA
jgi:hypothetical protein